MSNICRWLHADLAKQSTETSNFIVPLFIHNIERGLPIQIFDAQKVLDFTHVDDCVRAFRMALAQVETGSFSNHTINISGGAGHGLEFVACQLGLILGREPSIEFAEPRAGEIRHYVADLTRAQTLLGFTPAIPLAPGLERAVQWHRAWRTEHGEGARPPE